MFSKYGKAIAAALLAVVSFAASVYADGIVTDDEKVQVAIAVATAVSVYLVPILGWPWMKTAISAVLAALNVLATVIIGGLDNNDMVQIIVAMLTVAAVAVTPARSDPPPVDPQANVSP